MELTCFFILDMQSSSLKLFSSFEQKAMLLKRQAFAVFSGELDQYHLYLPLIQGKKALPPPSLPSPPHTLSDPQWLMWAGC